MNPFWHCAGPDNQTRVACAETKGANDYTLVYDSNGDDDDNDDDNDDDDNDDNDNEDGL